MPDPTMLERLVAEVARADPPAARRVLRRCAACSSGAVAGRSCRSCCASSLGPLGLRARRRAPAGAGVLAGALCGLPRSVPPADVARLADRGFGLQDRVATALEWADAAGSHARSSTRSSPTPRRASSARAGGAIVPRASCRARRSSCPLPLVAGPGAGRWRRRSRCPQGGLPNFSVVGRGRGDKPKERGGRRCRARTAPAGGQARPAPARGPAGARLGAARGRRRARASPAISSAVFKDTSLGSQRARLQLASSRRATSACGCSSRWTGCPTCSSDFTQSQTRWSSRRPRRCAAACDPNKISPEKLRELLEEMERLGRKGGGNNLERRRLRGHGGARGRPDRQGHGGHGAGARTRCAPGGAGRATARACGAAARATVAAASAGTRPRPGQGGARGRGRLPRGRGAACPARARARSPRAIRRQRLRAQSLRRGRRGRVAARAARTGIDTNMIGRGGQHALAPAVPGRPRASTAR